MSDDDATTQNPVRAKRVPFEPKRVMFGSAGMQLDEETREVILVLGDRISIRLTAEDARALLSAAERLDALKWVTKWCWEKNTERADPTGTIAHLHTQERAARRAEQAKQALDTGEQSC